MRRKQLDEDEVGVTMRGLKMTPFTDWGKYISKRTAPKDVHENMIIDERLGEYKGVYHHYGQKQLNDAPQR